MPNTHYTCPNCHQTSTAHEWDTSTLHFYKADDSANGIVSIAEIVNCDPVANFYCPKCSTLIFYDNSMLVK